ncbi:hypothetical protein E2320_003448, partial [Naja naja]
MIALVLLVLVLLPLAVCKIPNFKCNVSEPLPIHHKYYKSGDLIMAFIISHTYRFSNPTSYEKRPSSALFGDFVHGPFLSVMTNVMEAPVRQKWKGSQTVVIIAFHALKGKFQTRQ